MTRKYHSFTDRCETCGFVASQDDASLWLNHSHYYGCILKRAFCYTLRHGTTVMVIAIRLRASAVPATSTATLQSPATLCIHLQRLCAVFICCCPFHGSNITLHRTELLKDEFLNVPVRHITNVIKQQKTLYKAHGVIEKQVRDHGQVAKTFSRINKSRIKRGIELQLIEKGSQIPKELHAAKKKSQVEASKWDVVTMTFRPTENSRHLSLFEAACVIPFIC
jgi:hypothetical protein